MNRDDRAFIISDAWNSQGGRIIQGIIDEMISEDKEALYHTMSVKPDTLTGKMSIARASRARALENLKERIAEEIKTHNHLVSGR